MEENHVQIEITEMHMRMGIHRWTLTYISKSMNNATNFRRVDQKNDNIILRTVQNEPLAFGWYNGQLQNRATLQVANRRMLVFHSHPTEASCDVFCYNSNSQCSKCRQCLYSFDHVCAVRYHVCWSQQAGILAASGE